MRKLFVTFGILLCSAAHAGLCEGAFLHTSARPNVPDYLQLDPNDVHRNQRIVTDWARANGLPAFTISIPAGDVPVVLLNRHTVASWSTVLEQTFGLNQSMHPNSKANHGWARLPGRISENWEHPAGKILEETPNEAAFVDLYSPSASGDQALHDTGYRWKWLSEYFRRRHADSFVHIEQGFALTREDQIKVWLYHLVKRSAVVRIQYMFDEHNNWFLRQKRRVLQQDGNFNSRRYGEHCNNCRIGAAAINHASEMRGRMANLFNQDVNHIYGLNETRLFLDKAKKKLLYRDWRNGADLHPDLMNDDYFIELLNPYFRWGISREEKVDALSYLVATNIFEEVVQVKDRYGMTEDVAMNLDNRNVSVFFVYSDLPDSPDRFREGNFEFIGANGAGFSAKWPGLNPRPIR